MDSVAKRSPRERTQLFETAEARHAPRIAAAIIEKDFWVCWTLRRLFEALQFRPQLTFKGGTSLSKVFNVIDRFSEDVDLSLTRRDLGFSNDRDPEQAGISKNEGKRRLEALVEQCRRTVRERLLPELRRDFAAVLGASGWSVDLDADDQQTVIFSYPPSDLSGALPYVKPGTFHLSPPTAQADALRRDYDAMQTILFGESPRWDEIIRELKQLEGRING